MPNLKSFLRGFAIIAIILTIVPLFAVDYWWIRMFDFPHLQLTILTLIAFLVYYFRFNYKNYTDYAYVLILLSCFLFQMNKIKQFTPFYDFEVKEGNLNSNKPKLSLFTANVLQDNENSDSLIKTIQELKADVLLFTEVNKKWCNTLSEAIKKDYKYSIKQPLSNTYGMMLFSKKELINPTIQYLVDDSIPSIHTKIKFSEKDTLQFYGIHPTPPMPQHNPMSTERDAEMIKIAQLSSKSKLPVIVMGDFNDVAWSETMQLFKANSLLLDARIGRGFYSTFSAENLILRWPLDHIFSSKEFTLLDIKSCSSIDSDHFPYYVKFEFDEENAHLQTPKQPTESQIQRAENQLKNFEDAKIK